MILQALSAYYQRKASEPQGGLAPAGFESKAIPYVLVLDAAGQLLQLAKLSEGEGKKKTVKAQLVPQGVKKTSGVAANLLWDSLEYVLGVDTRGKPERVAEQQRAFVQRIEETFGVAPEEAGVAAVLAFLRHGKEAALALLAADPEWPEIVAGNPLFTFRLLGDTLLVCQRPAVIAQLQGGADQAEAAATSICLVSGEADRIERLHPAIKGVWGAQTSGANIVSFNLDAFTSYGKAQSFNAPVGQRAAFAYTTALNHLLAKGSRQRVQVGDASTVFWAEKSSGASFEAAFLDFLKPVKEDGDDPDRGSQAVASLYASVRQGLPFCRDDGQRFYVLGLAPNAARIAVRFWHVATIAELGRAFHQHFSALEIVRPAFDSAPLTLFRLLACTALQGKAENIPPNLGGELMRAILGGQPYPATLLQACLRRIRAEREVGPVRAALLKAIRIRNFNDQEIAVSLNPENNDPGYRLGRLFAALERAQERAQGNLNASIRERYYGAFSSTPTTVLPLLMKLKNHHLAKLNPGEKVNLEKLFGDIVDGLPAILPARLSLAEQASFAVGYYQQRQAFFSKSESTATDKE